MLPDDAHRATGTPDPDQSAGLRIDGHRTTLAWRVRIGAAAGPVALIVMQELPPVAVFLLGFGTAVGVMSLGSAVARVEVWARRTQRGRGDG